MNHLRLPLILILALSALASGSGFLALEAKEELVEALPDSPWEKDLDTALAKAKAGKKLVIADFTGSDWCGWCIKLKKEVFDTEVFMKGVEGKYILAEIDFPQDKSLVSPEQLQKNMGYKERYKDEVKGFPTILVLDGDGKILGQTGYQPGGPEKYLVHLVECAQPGFKEKQAAKQKELEEKGKLLQETYAKAETAYKAKSYEEAAKHFVAVTAMIDIPEILKDAHYNAACCFALLGNKAEALKHLELSLKNGWADFDHIAKDTDLDALREDEAFKALIAKHSAK